MAIALLFVFGLALIAGPIAADATGHSLGTLANAVMLPSGVVLVLLAGILITITKLYRKAKASEAFVKTGMGGKKVVKDGGALVVPVIHEVIPVTLEMIRLEVKRVGADALLTKDNLRADVTAEFFIRVKPDEESIYCAAMAFGDQMLTHFEMKVADKLINALRNAATGMSLQDLNSNRIAFVTAVTESVQHDIKPNGLMLESVTISKLDQTDPKTLRDDNIFDAQGKATIAKIVQEKQTERNALERQGEQERAKQDVETRKRVLQLDQEKATAEAEQAAEIAKVRAEQDRDAQEKQIEAARAIELANVEKSKQTEVAMRAQQQAIETAERDKQAAIADAQAKQADAEAKLATAEASREKERQAVTTVRVQAEAEREKATKVIAAEATAQTTFVQAQKAADAEAYATQKKAEGQKAAADAEAEAITKKANAEASAAEARAKGAQAEAMVPVHVKQAEVEIEQRKVDVLRQELQAREEHGATMQQFEIQKLRVTKEAEIRIAGAHAMAQLSGTIHANVFGTPEDVARMTKSYMQGMGVSSALDGFFANASNDTKELAENAGTTISNLLRAAAARLEGGAEAPTAPSGTSVVAAAPSSATTQVAKGAKNGESAG
jgi:flotillin